ncbi:equilibrative nucleoside transporter 3-like isoform X2 [Paramacrobiotus metropolitanus]|uniref:equilibrative nucleoside transporter 3-like isoform X2 n=1 Tax=Paramacrobiotus metropolitanus TaxID=2943436 RepID=UPI00244638E7|nr:equilibrative nucleoside transporter 3-like isoform X2 [Paramacrobiotus metropolitanus]
MRMTYSVCEIFGKSTEHWVKKGIETTAKRYTGTGDACGSAAATDYFRYSFRNVTNPERPTTLQNVFESTLALISSGVGLLGIAVNTVLTRYVLSKIRILSGLIAVVTIFIATAVLAKVDTDTWQHGFFGVTILNIVLIRFSSNLTLGGLYGIQGCLPFRFATALMVGQATAGIFAALAEIVSVVAGNGVAGKDAIKTEACGYFASAVGMSFLAVIGFLILLRLPVIQFYLFPSSTNVVIKEESKPDDAHPAITVTIKEKFSFRIVFSCIWTHALVAFSNFFVTLSLYPAVATAVRSVSAASGSLLTNGLFTPLSCFLVANTADLAGRLAHGFLRWPDPQQRFVTLLIALLRFGFIPVMLLCNAQPRTHLPVVFGDAVLVACIALMLFTSGYLGNLVIMYGPKMVPPQFAETTGSLMGVCLSSGALLGSALSFGFIAAL